MDKTDKPGRTPRSGFRIAVVLLSLFLIFSVLVNFTMLAGMVLAGRGIRPGDHPQDEYPRLEERWSYGSGDVKAARVAVAGVIARQWPHGFFSASERDLVEDIQRQVRAAANDESVKAIILEIDSPGGEITAVDEIYNSLLDFKSSSEDRKIIAFVSGLAASGGYYVAAAADWIIAEPTAVVGSISAIMQTLNWKVLSDKLGVRDVTIKTGENKDLLNPFNEVNPEQVALLQDLLNDMHQIFFNVVLTERNMDRALLTELADGRVFTARQALSNGLVDQVGYWKNAIERVCDMLGEESVKIVRYEEKPGFLKMFSRIRSPLIQFPLMQQQRPRLMYIWNP